MLPLLIGSANLPNVAFIFLHRPRRIDHDATVLTARRGKRHSFGSLLFNKHTPDFCLLRPNLLCCLKNLALTTSDDFDLIAFRKCRHVGRGTDAHAATLNGLHELGRAFFDDCAGALYRTARDVEHACRIFLGRCLN